MRFKISSAGNHSTYGDLFFSLPSDEEIKKAEIKVEQLCIKQADLLYGNNQLVAKRIKTELKLMKKTKTAFYFLILREVALFSKSHSAPILLEGTEGASLLQYLLEISEVNPLAFSLHEAFSVGYDQPIEMMWGNTKNPIVPFFSFQIAPFIRPLLHSQLCRVFGHIKDDKNLYCQFSMIDSEMCNKIAMLTTKNTKPYQVDSHTFLAAYKTFPKRLLSQCESVDFAQLTRLCAYDHGSFCSKKNAKALQEPNFYVTRDEFFIALVESNVPRDIAYDIVKHGVWSNGERKKKYADLLQAYGTSEALQTYFYNASNLWPAAACASRLLLSLKMRWLENNC